MKFTTGKLLATALGLAGLSAGFTNPIRRPGGSDPYLTRAGDGYYYLMTTSWTDLRIARATTIEGLKTAEKKVIYSDADPSRCCNVWAPEVHFLDGAWYVYYTAGHKENVEAQNLHVLKGGASPWDNYTYAGQLSTEWTIDGSILQLEGRGKYLLSSCFHGVKEQSLCIQKLGDDNVSVEGAVSVISQPDQAWERSGTPVNEGPVALFLGGRTYITYSANYCWTPDYCLATLEWDGQTDPLSPDAWTKSDGCLLKSANGHYGTGHNSFFQSPDGKQIWNAYHATSNSAGACDDTRYTRVQIVETNADGSPNFGTPVADSFDSPEPGS